MRGTNLSNKATIGMVPYCFIHSLHKLKYLAQNMTSSKKIVHASRPWFLLRMLQSSNNYISKNIVPLITVILTGSCSLESLKRSENVKPKSGVYTYHGMSHSYSNIKCYYYHY